MEVIIKPKNMEVTKPIREYAEKKVSKLQRFFQGDSINSQVVVSIEKGLQIAEVTIQVNGLILRGEEKTGDMYASIDGAVDKIERQIRKYKTKINRRLRQTGASILDAEFSPRISEIKERHEEPKLLE
mgnify:CR=1 FL=1